MCSSPAWKKSEKFSQFESLYSCNTVKLYGWCCSNKECSWKINPSIKSIFGNKVHPELIKLQAEFGSNQSYRSASKSIRAITGKQRKINNHSRIHKITNEIGEIIDQHEESTEQDSDTLPSAKKLIVAVDGGHVHDAKNVGKNFEAMLSKSYKPENVIKIDKHHTKIIEKHCAGSAKYDKQETMKNNVLTSSKKAGMTENTEVIALADGAKNCWNIINYLANHCSLLTLILDWFHIGKYITNIKKQLPSHEQIFNYVRDRLWFGDVTSASTRLSLLLNSKLSADEFKKIDNFHIYIKDNEDKIVNYNERKKLGLIYTSHIAESTVEHLLNERSKRKQKMSWSRNGLHAVLLIRASQSSNDWNSVWKNIILPHYQSAA